MASDFRWLVKERDWNLEVSTSKPVPVKNHPLSSQHSIAVPNKFLGLPALPTECPLDPLSLADGNSFIDSKTKTPTILHEAQPEELKQLWTDLINELNSSCSTNANVLVSAYLPPPEHLCNDGSSDQGSATPAPAAVVGPNVKTSLTGRQCIAWRLKQLELHEGGKSAISAAASAASVGFTNHQFSEWLAAAKTHLQALWTADKRSLALKLTIQCVRFLSMLGPPEFYGTKFVLITDLLDTLADLVQGRVSGNKLALETGRNWLSKIASIRELLPRLYLQAALLPVSALLSQSEYESTLGCIFGGARGVSDGVVNAFLRIYSLRKAAATRGVRPQTNGVPYSDAQIKISIQEAVAALQWSWSNDDTCSDGDWQHRSRLIQPLLLYAMKLFALTPAALDETVCKDFLRPPGMGSDKGPSKIECSSSASTLQFSVLCSALQALPPQAFAVPLAHSIAQLTALRQTQGAWSNSWCSCVLTHLADRLLLLGPVSGVALVPLLAAVLPLLQPMEIECYLTAATPWLAFAAIHCSVADMESLLRHMVRRVTTADSVPAALLVAMLRGVLERATSAVCYTESMLALLAVAQSCCSDAALLSQLLGSVLLHNAAPLTSAPLVQQLLALAEAVHNSHSLLTTEDERRLLSQLVSTVIQRVTFHDPEEQLGVLVAVRAAFPQLHSVLVALVHAACSLLVRTARLSRNGRVNVSLARSCVAFSFISIASLECPAQRLRLYLLTASVARQHAAHGQADSCLKASIRDLNVCLNSPSPPCPTGDCWAHCSPTSWVGAIAGALVGTPNPPTSSSGVYLIRGLVQAVMSGSRPADATSIMVWCQALNCACGACQSSPVYAPATVEPLLLCGASPEQRAEAEQLCEQLLQHVCHACSSVRNGAEYSGAASQALLTVSCWLASKAHSPSFTSALAPLWSLLQRNPQQAHVLRWLQQRFSSPVLR
ncbi:VPS35 endosomal protein-sorting factor-like isoform X2 [Hyalella azteca]|uniref:VPS35 endosomal protein-sorting factor-like isoform X2 n=1 Tax=Hyalella azteca TaxID=294128 RepID=A0A979FFB1_HYAAZ|nr:VPS35 endosomal protein-sorting factor-like isoform X2 [Hyalella azteca]